MIRFAVSKTAAAESELRKIHSGHFSKEESFSSFEGWMSDLIEVITSLSICYSGVQCELTGESFYVFYYPLVDESVPFHSKEFATMFLSVLALLKEAGGAIRSDELSSKLPDKPNSTRLKHFIRISSKEMYLYEGKDDQGHKIISYGPKTIVELKEKLLCGIDFQGKVIKLFECFLCKKLIALDRNRKQCASCNCQAHSGCIEKISTGLPKSGKSNWTCASCVGQE